MRSDPLPRCVRACGIVCAATLLLSGCQAGDRTAPPPVRDLKPKEPPQLPADGSAADPRSPTYRAPVQAETMVLDVPDTGVGLGWGWNRSGGVPLSSICIEFVQAEEPAQTRFMTMKEVTSNFELMQSLGMSAEASVKTIGFEAQGKASFARDVSISTFASTFVMNARVENGVRYAAPIVHGAAGNGELRLTPEALALAMRADPTEFLHRCGHGYVSAIFSGAKLTAVITVDTSSRADKQKVTAELSGSGWGARFKGAMEGQSQSASVNANTDVSIFQTGGRGDAIPVSKQDVLDKLGKLPSLAIDAPKGFHMAVEPYARLSNWPAQRLDVPTDEFEQIGILWGAYKAVYDDIQEVLDEPARFRGVRLDPKGSGCWTVDAAAVPAGLSGQQVARLEQVQDEVLDALGRLRNFAQACSASRGGCAFPEHEFRSPYAYRVQMPLEVPPPTPATQGKPGLPAPLQDYSVAGILAQHVADPAKRHCDDDTDHLLCLSNAQIKAWRDRVGMAVRTYPTMEERDAAAARMEGFKRFGEPMRCNGRADRGEWLGPAYSVEEKYPALWIDPRNLSCLDGTGAPDPGGTHCKSNNPPTS